MSQAPESPAPGGGAARPRISARIGGIAESATLAVDAKAKALKAAGRPVIGFGAGEPDFPTPEYIVEAAVEACRDPRNHRYTPAGGLPELKQAIAAKTFRDSGYEVERTGRLSDTFSHLSRSGPDRTLAPARKARDGMSRARGT